MKKILSLTALLFSAVCMNAQTTAKDVFTTNELIWYGLDFSKAHFVGQFDQGFGALPASGTDMRDKWVPEWNAIFMKEPQNFDLRKTFRKEYVLFNLEPVKAVNLTMDVDDAMSLNERRLSPEDLAAMVSKYNGGDKKSGIGLVFIVENFNKAYQEATMHVVFFDIATKKILFSEKETGKATGAGMRNYWAHAFKVILKSIDGGDYKSWKFKYGQ